MKKSIYFFSLIIILAASKSEAMNCPNYHEKFMTYVNMHQKLHRAHGNNINQPGHPSNAMKIKLRDAIERLRMGQNCEQNNLHFNQILHEADGFLR